MKHECPNCGCKFSEAILSEKPAHPKRFTLSDSKAAFWARVNKSDGCWTYPAGSVKVLGKPMEAHRFAWISEKGAVPKGKVLLHNCGISGGPLPTPPSLT